MQITILAYWIYDISHYVRLVGELGLWEAIPAIACSFFSGHFIDQKEKRNILLTCSLIYVATALYFFGLSYWHGSELSTAATVRLVFLGIFIGGVVRSFIGPTTFTMVSLLVPRENLASATSWSSTSWYWCGGWPFNWGTFNWFCGRAKQLSSCCLCIMLILFIDCALYTLTRDFTKSKRTHFKKP